MPAYPRRVTRIVLVTSFAAVLLAGALVVALEGTLAGMVAALTVGVVAATVLGVLVERWSRGLAASVDRALGPAEDDGAAPSGDATGFERAEVEVARLVEHFELRGRRLAEARDLRIELVDALHDPSLLFSADGQLVRANPAARERFGIGSEAHTPAQALGSARLADAVREAVERGDPVEVEATIGGRDLAALAAPVGDETLLLIRDQTERRRIDAVRRDFVANASHELKTPVSGIQVLAEALTGTIERGDHDRSRELSVRLEDEAERLSKLVVELIDLRRLEEGGDLARTPVDLVPLVIREVERVTPRAQRRAVTVACDLPDQAVVAGVEQDLQLIVANLLDNAVGYNEEGGRVDIALDPRDGSWTLTVADTGIGIARGDLDRIFERFYRVDLARSRQGGGTGLGLSIVRHATERHGGSVRVESILGEGTTFTVTLPVEPPS